MRTFKSADLIIQGILILGTLLAFALWPKPETPIFGYFVVGGWQVISMVVHWIARYNMWRWSHRAVHTVVMCLPAIGGLLILWDLDDSDTVIMVLFMFYFGAPLLAIWYWVLCYLEWKRWKKIEEAAQA